ncbi:MAG: CPBP family glutamic-type intramembrane protease [Solirubrobacteraceae bacterium]
MESLKPPSTPGEPRPPAAVDSFERALAAERREREGGTPDWPPWMAPAALVGALVLAAVGGLIVDLPAAAFGVDITSKHIPGGLEIADTVVQDLVFVLTAVLFARMGGRRVRAWQFGLRPPRLRMLWVVLLPVGLFVAFLIFSVIWAGILDESTKEKILEQLGANEGTSLLLLSAALTCVVAPICEEFLFRGFIFTALRNWRGTWPAAILTGLLFGGVHVGSAPAVDLVPLAFLGFGLCLLYRVTGSLYPCIAAHSLNNSIAYGSLESWKFLQVIALIAGSLLLIGAIALAGKRVGLITPPPESSSLAPSVPPAPAVA